VLQINRIRVNLVAIIDPIDDIVARPHSPTFFSILMFLVTMTNAPTLAFRICLNLKFDNHSSILLISNAFELIPTPWIEDVVDATLDQDKRMI
jgi:hypothetical protein